MLFYEFCVLIYKELCDNFSPQQDFCEVISRDLSFPKYYTEYYDIQNYLQMRQNGDDNYFNGYEPKTIETVFNFVWEKYEQYLWDIGMDDWYL